MNTTRNVCAVLAVAAGSVLMGAPAYANKPVLNEASFPVEACGTSLTLTIAVDGEKTREQKDGSFRTTGVFKVRFTNELTGQSVLVNGSGPGTLVPQSDGTIVLFYEGRAVGVSETLDPGAVYWSAGPGSVNWDTGAVGQVPPVFRNLCDQLT